MRKTVLPILCLVAACHAGPPDGMSELKHGGGTIVDNGGVQLNCNPAPAALFAGNYMLDYVVTYDPSLGFGDDVHGATWEDYRAHIEAFLGAKMPAVLPSFQAYADLLGNTDEGKERVWKASALDLVPLNDQNLTQIPPSNCLKADAAGTMVPDLTQLVRREEYTTDTARKVRYYYDFDRVQALKTTQPLQYSYLVVHEWLWDFTDAPWIDRTINHMLHSQHAATMTADEFVQDLKSLGIEITADGHPGPQGPAEGALRALFAADNMCDADQRFTVEVQRFDRENLVVLAPGESKDFDVKVPADLIPSSNWTACGFALVMSYQGTGGADAPLHFALRRGVAPPFERDLVASSAGEPQQQFYAGLCHDLNCIFKDGDLADLLTQNNFPSSEWHLTVANTGAGPGNVELLDPYFTFVQMQTPCPTWPNCPVTPVTPAHSPP